MLVRILRTLRLPEILMLAAATLRGRQQNLYILVRRLTWCVAFNAVLTWLPPRPGAHAAPFSASR
jgi:hypothetical protein